MSTVFGAMLREYFSAGLLLVATGFLGHGASGKTTDDSEFVDIKSVEQTIIVDLRYAGSNNVTHRPLYPPGTPALVRASVARRLAVA